MTHSARTVELDQGWRWKEHDVSQALDARTITFNDSEKSKWARVATFPSEVHAELLHAGRIPDPYVGYNEHLVQWVGEREWLYQTAFTTEGSVVHAALVFDGLDTFCDVYLDGELILTTENMFRSNTVYLTHNQLNNANHTLLLHFKSAKIIAKEREAQYGRFRAGSMNVGDTSRLHVRKAQYDWRWDWGPELMTAGPYRPIRVITYTARISTLHTPATLLPSDGPHGAPALEVHFGVEGTQAAVKRVRVELKLANGKTIREEEVEARFVEHGFATAVKWTFKPGEVDIWWPNGYGEQPLYDVCVAIIGENGDVLDVQTKRVGFRSVELLQEPILEPDQYGTGTTFLFAVNGVKMFMGGSNWIPADNLLTTISASRYRAWLELLAQGNQRMVRIWGGGIYEHDAFFDACDELGLLVWQDFMFACGVYPIYDSFVKEVRAEAEDVVKRLRHHPSLAIFCGNNEDYQQLTQWPDVPELPAKLLYEHILPETVKKLTHGAPVPYHPGSPYGGRDPGGSDPTIGDVHQWEVWGGRERPWQEYEKMGGRFVSEFGIPSMPDLRTVDFWAGDEDAEHKRPGSRMLLQHCRAGQAERRFAVVLNENCRPTGDFETYLFNTRMVQADAMAHAYRAWRREWRGPGKYYNGGVLVWQANDCWPVTSWAIIDYFLRPKPAYYTIARELALITAGISRTVHKDRPSDRPRQFYEFGTFRSLKATLDAWVTNETLASQTVTVELAYFDLASSWSHRTTHPVTIVPNGTTEVLSGVVALGPEHLAKGYPPGTHTSATVVVHARVLDKQGQVIARTSDWPQPLAHIDVPDPGLTVSRQGDKLTLRVERPVRSLVLDAAYSTPDVASKAAALGWKAEGWWDGGYGDREISWSDNALDLVPGEERTIRAVGLGNRDVTAAWFGREKAEVVLKHVQN